tara:strand:- start:21 stop:809 length:789 start_codon:yes stop_codon:yes gene_type:complete
MIFSNNSGAYSSIGTGAVGAGYGTINLCSGSGGTDIRFGGIECGRDLVTVGGQFKNTALSVKGSITSGSGINVLGTGINYTGSTIGGGTSNSIGFRWASPHIKGTVDNVVTTTVGTVSDYRLKTVSTNDIGDSLSRIKSLNTYQYTIKGDEEEAVHRGVLAHEAAKLFPELVDGIKDDPDQLQSVNYAGFTMDLIQAVKQLDARLTAIEAHLNIEAAELVIPDYEPVASPDFVFPVAPEEEVFPTEEELSMQYCPKQFPDEE